MLTGPFAALCLATFVGVWASRKAAPGPFPSSLPDLVCFGAICFYVVPEIGFAIGGSGNSPPRATIDATALGDWQLLVATCAGSFSVGVMLAECLPRGLRRPAKRASHRFTRSERLFAVALILLSLVISLAMVSGLVRSQDTEAMGALDGTITSTSLPLIAAGCIASVAMGIAPLPVISISAAALFLFGSRSVIPWVALSAIVVLRRQGVRIGTGSLASLAAICLGAAMAITTIRERSERWQQDTLFFDRLALIAQSVSATDREESGTESTVSALAARLDGSSYGARVLLSQTSTAVVPMGWGPVENSLLLTIPSAVWPNKLQRSHESRNEELASVLHHGIPEGPEFDYLPTLLGSSVSLLGWRGAVLSSMLFGLLLATLDRLLPWSNLTLLAPISGVCIALLQFEGNTETLILNVREIFLAGSVSLLAWGVITVIAPAPQPRR